MFIAKRTLQKEAAINPALAAALGVGALGAGAGAAYGMASPEQRASAIDAIKGKANHLGHLAGLTTQQDFPLVSSVVPPATGPGLIDRVSGAAGGGYPSTLDMFKSKGQSALQSLEDLIGGK